MIQNSIPTKNSNPPPQVIGGELQERLIPVPYSKTSTDQAIRVVNAFRHGMDSEHLQQATSNPNIQRVLQKQASLSKRLSAANAAQLEAAANAAGGANTRIKIPETSFSHTETAV
eukprot:snap_masked-scaffold1040_size68023-processed-gene-0.3 protein:Tk07634 transcript:snap_masked-scaffold1040_size68023-processed-gene-0.3-mRNA-1 annotation:"plasma membrane calcium-transporting atpase 3 isoform 1"